MHCHKQAILGLPVRRLSLSKSTAVFGEYIDIYDVQRAVEDKALGAGIYYESRLVDLGMDDSTKQWLDQEVDDLLEGEEMSRQDKLKAEYAQKMRLLEIASACDLLQRIL